MTPRKEKLTLLEQWLEDYKSNEAVTQAYRELFDIQPSKAYNAIWNSFDFSTKCLAEVLGDKDASLLEWYCTDCSMNLTENSPARSLGIFTLDDLLSLIERNQNETE